MSIVSSLKSFFYKFLWIVATIALTLSSGFNAFALTDTKIFTDSVDNVYIGRPESWDILINSAFDDVPKWAEEAVIRTSAYGIVKGYSNSFNPGGTVSNQEALAFILRAMGLENDAQTKAVELKDTTPQYNLLVPTWANGYLALAQERGLISDVEYLDTLVPEQNTLDPAASFFKAAPASRERVADWIVKAINSLSSDLLTVNDTSQQSIYKFSDWQLADISYVQSLELLCANGVLSGTEDGRINPKGSVTRAEMAQILSNLDNIYLGAMGMEKRTGTVGGIQDAQLSTTGADSVWRNVYIRNMDGKVDVLQYQMQSTNSPQDKTIDAPVYFGDSTYGTLAYLLEGDQIEYIVKGSASSGNANNNARNNNNNNNVNGNSNEVISSPVQIEDPNQNNNLSNNTDVQPTVIFVKKTGGLTRKEVQGKLMEIDYANGLVYILDNLGKRFSYPIADGLYGADENGDNYIIMGEKRYINKTLPYGSTIKVALANNIVDNITYVGDMNLQKELRGIVVENNTSYGYLTVIDNNGNEVTKNYYPDQIEVEKQEYYDLDDETGYLDQVFPDGSYDPRDTLISNVEAGDIVFIRTYNDDPDTIESISASPNYIMKYGKVNNYVNDGTGVNQLMLQYENGQTAWFDVADSVFASKAGKPIEQSEIQSGDWVKVLVNQAIISPGYVMESVKEITVEGTGHEINTIIKGQLGAINNIQNKISVQDSYTLTKKGWDDYKEIRDISIANNDITYYYEGKQITLDYAMRFLKHSDNDVYIAMENNYSGEKVSMVSFRTSRDDVLSSDTIVNSDGVGNFNISSRDGTISTDSGTIVRRYGRLVTGQNIMIPDFATVVLNGNNKAAVVDIYDQPDASGVIIGRGRILSVDQGKSFSLKSTGILSGTKWVYSPVERTFQIDHNTMYIDETGVSSMENFIDYTTNSAINKVYNIVSDGTKATHVVNSPYSKDCIRGEVVTFSEESESDGSGVVIRNATYKRSKEHNWDSISNVNNSINVNIPSNSIIVKNNKVVGVSQIEKGDKITVLTEQIPSRVQAGMSVTGYIILVEG